MLNPGMTALLPTVPSPSHLVQVACCPPPLQLPSSHVPGSVSPGPCPSRARALRTSPPSLSGLLRRQVTRPWEHHPRHRVPHFMTRLLTDEALCHRLTTSCPFSCWSAFLGSGSFLSFCSLSYPRI